MMRKRKMFNIIGIIIVIMVLIAMIIVFGLMFNHNNKLRNESKDFLPLGTLIEINNKKLHVYAEGEGEITLVFMAGHGTSSPALDFKPLWMRMTDEYRIAVVEKSGYGWSDTSNSSRDIDTMLEETRKALELADEKGPYVLVPHSMSGLEAIYWAQKYPEEVKAIIGLDACTPEAIEILPEAQMVQLYAMFAISRIGLSRLMPENDVQEMFPVLKSNVFSEDEKKQYISMFYRSSFTKDMLREVKFMKDNAKIVSENTIPSEIPMYFFISMQQNNSVPGWNDSLQNYLTQITNAKHMNLDAGHYLHYDKSDILAQEIKSFIEEIS